MPVETVTAEWVRDQVFLLRDHQGFPILMANPGGVLGADLLPLSLIGCAIWDVTEILRKQRQPVRRLEVKRTASGKTSGPGASAAFGWSTASGERRSNGAAVERAVRLTEDKYCSTVATLKPAIEIVSEVELIPGGSEAAETH